VRSASLIAAEILARNPRPSRRNDAPHRGTSGS
jgi:hypothetical protein